MRSKKIISIILILFISIFIVSCSDDSAESPEDKIQEVPNDDKESGEENNKDNNDNDDKAEEESNWDKYTNVRFKFSIKYPKGWEYRESDNGDGIAFFSNDDEKDIIAHGVNYLEGVSKPYKSAEAEELEKEEKTLESGLEATIIEGKMDENYHYEMVYIKDNKEYHFISVSPIEYYNENKEIIQKMANSFDIIDSEDNSNNGNNDSNKKELTKKKAIEIEDEFMNRLLVDKSDNGKIKDYNNKNELINHLSEITKKDIAKSYINNYYKEKEDGLYIIPKDGPTRIYKDKSYRLEKIDDQNYELIQEAEDQLRGKYKFTVKFTYKDNKWIISDRIFEKRDKNDSSNQILGDNLIVKSMKTLKLIKEKDMEKLALYVHPDKGLRFSPYAYIDTKKDQNFTKDQVANLLEDDKKYEWGSYDGKGSPIKLKFKDYYDEFVYSKDFINPHIIGNNISIGEGNTINNIKEAYKNGKFIEYHFEGSNPEYKGMDWQSLRLVFEQVEDTWYLLGIVHSEWTI